MTERAGQAAGPDWLSALRRYLLFSGLAHLLWEIAHTPLYTIWVEGTPSEIAFAIVYCTGGDLLIATNTLLLALFMVGNARWPEQRVRPVILAAVLMGVSYTVFSEWLNIEVRGAWAYREAMPVVPLLDAGLTPLLQWVVAPVAAYFGALRTLPIGRRPN